MKRRFIRDILMILSDLQAVFNGYSKLVWDVLVRGILINKAYKNNVYQNLI